jgi:hypothetical protein
MGVASFFAVTETNHDLAEIARVDGVAFTRGSVGPLAMENSAVRKDHWFRRTTH